MRILVLGATGMLGHQLLMSLSQQHDTWGTIRGSAAQFPPLPHIQRDRLITGVDAASLESIIRAFSTARPELVINCIGLIKQHKETPVLQAIDLNARLPHQLAMLCQSTGSRLIHISTDCVFSGEKGCYTETDPTDAQDVYGKTKALGEVVDEPHVLTIRTSLIGRELFSRLSLVEWFLSQQDSVKGFRNAIFSGFPTHVVADILKRYIVLNADLYGLYHISAKPISKYDLLCLMREAYHHQIEIIPDEAFKIDRSLNSDRFQKETGFVPPDWKSMITTTAAIDLPYESWK